MGGGRGEGVVVVVGVGGFDHLWMGSLGLFLIDVIGV